MDLLISLVIYFAVFGLIGLLIRYSPFDERFKQIAYFVLAVILVIVLIRLLFGGGLVVVRGGV